ncbi:MAG: glycosyltransferase family 39 protein [Caldilineaceae bacterium]
MNTTTLPQIPVRKMSWPWPKHVGFFLQFASLLIPLLFLAFMFWQDPFSEMSDFDHDEGINLIKASLYSQHYILYGEIWSDQPPFFTVLLAWWFSVVGTSVAAARSLVALFSALLLWSFYLAVRNSVTAFAAVGATLLLAVSQYYIRLSGSVMIGLPALALATLSIALLVRRKEQLWPLLLSAFVMALALETKLLVVLLMPAIGLYLLLTKPPAAVTYLFTQRLLRPMLWGAVVAAAFFALSLYFGALNFDMLINTHLGAQQREQMVLARGNLRFLARFLLQHAVYLPLAFLGVLYAFRQRKPDLILPVVWFGTLFIVFMVHWPLWYHYTVLLTLPSPGFVPSASMLGLQGLSGWPADLQAFRYASALLVSAALLLCLLFYAYPSPLPRRLAEQAQLSRPIYLRQMMRQLLADTRANRAFIFTDRPFYAFQAGLPVTPQTAVMSRKRIETGVRVEADVLKTLTTYQPEYIILQRFTDKYSPAVMAEIARAYELVLELPPGYYYRRNSR